MSRLIVRTAGLLFLTGLALFAGSGFAEAAKYKVLHQFCADQNKCLDGFALSAPLVRDPAGNLYGTAQGGGEFGAGTVFQLSPAKKDKWKLTVLHSFCGEEGCDDGVNPQTAVILDQSGNVYGVTASSTDGYGFGTIYKLTRHGTAWDYSIIHKFCTGGICDGVFPVASLSYAGQFTNALYDGITPLYGIASGGGAHGGGVAFTLTPQKHGWKRNDIYDFCAKGGTDCSDGTAPVHPFVVAEAHRLIGVTPQGIVFNLNSGDGVSWQQNQIYKFCSQPKCTDGTGAPSELTMGPTGILYGTTPSGGACRHLFACGTIFQIATDGTETVLYNFCKKVGGCHGIGSDPETGVTLGPDGMLYGTTVAGGIGSGAIYSFNGTAKLLHSFCDTGCEFGGNPRSSMIMDPAGHLFGVTPQGDTSGGGVIFELTP